MILIVAAIVAVNKEIYVHMLQIKRFACYMDVSLLKNAEDNINVDSL